MTFRATADEGVLSSILKTAGTLVDECKIRLHDDGIEIRAVDPANVAMVDVSADAAAFESYDADGGVIGINLERIQDVVSMADSGDLIELTLDEDARKLEVAVGGLNATLALIDPDSIRQEPDIPDLDLPATVAVEGRQVSRMVSAADLVSDHIAIGADVDAEEVYAEADGDTDDVELRLGNDDVLMANVDGDAHSLFSLDYLSDIESAIPNDGEVSLQVGEAMPTKLRYSVAGGGVQVQNMIAPRIQGD